MRAIALIFVCVRGCDRLFIFDVFACVIVCVRVYVSVCVVYVRVG